METKTLRQQFEEETGFNPADKKEYYDSVYVEWLESRLSAPSQNREVSDEQLFLNNSDCYADTWRNENGRMIEGDVIPAMTKDVFIRLLRSSVEGKPEEKYPVLGYKTSLINQKMLEKELGVSDKAVKDWDAIEKEYENSIDQMTASANHHCGIIQYLKQHYPVPYTDKGEIVFTEPKPLTESEVREFKEALKNYSNQMVFVSDKEDEAVERQAFEESRLTHPMVGFKHDDFEAYKSWKATGSFLNRKEKGVS